MCQVHGDEVKLMYTLEVLLLFLKMCDPLKKKVLVLGF